jgi:hypothetical protein
MNVRDIDTKLDMKLKLVISDNTDIFRWSKLHDLRMSIFIKEGSNKPQDYYFQAFIMKNKVHSEVKELIETYSPVETENYYMLSHPIVNTKILFLIKELWTVPSMAFGETTIENGKFILRIRFHRLYKKNLSLILNKYLAIPYFVEDMTLTESEGGIVLLGKKNSRMPLSIIQYSIPLSVHSENYSTKMLEKNNGIAQVVENPYNKKDFKVIIFSENHIEERKGVTCISEEDNIYETYDSNELLSLIRDKANSRGIFRNLLLIIIKDGRMYSNSVIASNRIMEYTKTVFSSSLELYGKNVVRLENSCEFDPELYGEFGTKN